MTNRMSRFFLVSILALAVAPWIATAQEATYRIAVDFDPEERTIDGAVEIDVLEADPTLYFGLLANLALDPNPYLAPRVVDAHYTYGFEPAWTFVTSVEAVTGNDAVAVPYRWLELPAAWQTYSLAETVLAVDLAGVDRPADEPLTLRLAFVTEVPRTTLGDEGITDGILTWRFGWFPALLPAQDRLVETDGAIGYDDVDAFPLTFPWANYEATVRVPAPYEVIAGTDRIEMDVVAGPEAGGEADAEAPATDEAEASEEDDAVEIREYVASNDAPARSLALTIGADYERFTLDGAIPIEVAYLPGHDEEARLLATYAIDILAAYEARFGPYPRTKLVVVENPNTDGRSFAADGIVWLSRWFFTHRNVLLPGTLNRLAEFVLAHEIAHQWVGLGTGIDLNTEAWLSEGLAQYLAIEYFESRYEAFEPNLFAPDSRGLIEEFVKRQFGYFNLREHLIELPYLLTQRIGFDEALIKPLEKVQFSNVSDVRLYDKGFLVARSIAATIGSDAFDRGLRRAVEERRAELLDARSLQALWEEESGVSLDEVFDVWVFGPGTVDYAIEIASRKRTDAGYETVIAMSRDGGAAQPVEIEATLTSGTTLRRTWDAVETTGELVLTTPSVVQRVTIDPEHRHPDRNRLNNNAPVKIVGAASSAVLPLDAYVIAPDTVGGAIFSHLDRVRIAVGQNEASARIKIGRNHLLTGSVSIATGDLLGRIEYTHTAYDQPEIGTAGTYCEAAIAIRVGVQRLRSDEQTLLAFSFAATDLPSLTDTRAHTVSIDVASNASARFALRAGDEFRILPGVYVRGSARIGVGVGPLPSALRFRIDELHTDLVPTANMMAASLALDIPDARMMPYNLLNLAMIDRMRSSLLLSAGTGWTTLDEFGKTSSNIEAGIEQVIEVSTLGGLIPVTVRLGVAVPLIGGGATVFYVSADL